MLPCGIGLHTYGVAYMLSKEISMTELRIGDGPDGKRVRIGKDNYIYIFQLQPLMRFIISPIGTL